MLVYSRLPSGNVPAGTGVLHVRLRVHHTVRTPSKKSLMRVDAILASVIEHAISCRRRAI